MIEALTVPFLYDGCCFSLIEQDVSVFFVRRFQLSVEVVVPIRRLMCCLFFHIILFWIRWNGRELHILSSCFPTAPLMSVSFALLFVLYIMRFCILFADVCVL